MSYILDALKKADQERTLGEVPDLEVAHWGERRQKRSYRWVWVVGALLLFNGVLLFMLIGRDEPIEPVVDRLPEMAESPAVKPVVPVPRTENAVTPPSSEIVRPREPVYAPSTTVVKQRPTTVKPPASAFDECRRPLHRQRPRQLCRLQRKHQACLYGMTFRWNSAVV